MEDMIALASCNGMGSNGLVSPVAGGDCKKQHDNMVGSTSSDIAGRNNAMIKKISDNYR